MAIEQKDILPVGRTLISLLKAELLGQTPPELPDGFSLEKVFQMAKRHGVETMSGHAAFSLRNGPEGLLYEQWKKSITVNTAKNMVQRSERDRILDMLANQHIDAVPLKGCLMIEMYPRPDQRQMADLDILIRCSDQEKVRDGMIKLGYDVERYQITNEDTYQKKPFMHVEIHHDLFEKTSPHEKLRQYYADPWVRAVPDEDREYRYHFSVDDYYIYMLAHLYKHFSGGGCGVRNIMDIYVLLEKYGDSMDHNYLEKELKSLDLSDFRENMERLAHQWFDPEFHGKPVEEDIEMHLFSSGAYGRRDYSRRAGLRRLEEKYSSPVLARCAYLLRLLFPSYDRLIVMYPQFKGKQRVLPLLWIYHIGYKIFCDRERITGNIRLLRESHTEKSKKENE